MSRVLNFIKPFSVAFAIIIVLRLTGTLSSVSHYTNSAIMKTGIMDAPTEDEPTSIEPFDYNFNIKTLDGQVVDFNQFKGKVVFLNLWATWCGPCRAEMPTIQKLYEEVNKEKIEFVILSLDKDDALNKVIQYVDKNSYKFPVYQPKGYLPDQLKVPTIPTTLIIDTNGNVVSKNVGTTNFNTNKFKKYLEKLSN